MQCHRQERYTPSAEHKPCVPNHVSWEPESHVVKEYCLAEKHRNPQSHDDTGFASLNSVYYSFSNFTSLDLLLNPFKSIILQTFLLNLFFKYEYLFNGIDK